MTDAVSIYLEEHSIVNLLDGLANKLAASLPADPISFLINGLLEEAAARGQQTELVRRLLELRATLVDDQKEAQAIEAALQAAKGVLPDGGARKAGGGSGATTDDEKKKLEYRVEHLLRTLDDMERKGCGDGGAAPVADAPPAAVPVGHTAFSWAGGGSALPVGHTPFSWAAAGGAAAGGAVTPAVDAATAAAAPASGELRGERFSERVAVATLLKASEAAEGKRVVVCGWVRTNRVAKKLCFMSINDGSSNASLQLVIEKEKVDEAAWEAARGMGTGAAVRAEGPSSSPPCSLPARMLPPAGARRGLPQDLAGGRAEVGAARRSHRRRRAERRRKVPDTPAEGQPRDAARHHPHAPAHGGDGRGHAYPQLARVRNPHVLPVVRLHVCPRAPHHRRRLRRRRRDVPGDVGGGALRRNHPASRVRPSLLAVAGDHVRPRQGADGGGRRRLLPRLLRQARVPHRLGPAQRRVLCLRLRLDLHVRAHVPCGEFQHNAPPRRVLDDRGAPLPSPPRCSGGGGGGGGGGKRVG